VPGISEASEERIGGAKSAKLLSRLQEPASAGLVSSGFSAGNVSGFGRAIQFRKSSNGTGNCEVV